MVICNTPDAVDRISSVYRHGDVNNLLMASLVLVFRVSELVYVTEQMVPDNFYLVPSPSHKLDLLSISYKRSPVSHSMFCTAVTDGLCRLCFYRGTVPRI